MSSHLTIQYQHIELLAGKPGRVLPGLTWDAQSYDAQMKTLNEQVGKADKTHKEKGETEYREAAMPVIGRIRGACERIIEQHLLNGVIHRHDSRIDVKKTPTVDAVTTDHWKAVHAIWTACSTISDTVAPDVFIATLIRHGNFLKGWLGFADAF